VINETIHFGSRRDFVFATHGLSQTRGDKAIVDPDLKARLLNELRVGKQIKQDCGASAGRDEIVDIELQDLDRDGKPEYLISLRGALQYECSNGSTVWWYKKTAGGYVKLLAADTANHNIDHFSMKRIYHGGFADLELVTTQGPFVEGTDYIFNGSRYVVAKHDIVRVP
jgi:hypothetical protein